MSIKSKKPNIFFIICDELRADTLGYAGDSIVKTPFIDALSKDSIIFENAYCASPMCVPSRVSIATGRHPMSHGALDNSFTPLEDEKSLFNSFQDYGYNTVSFGKWHTNKPAEKWGWNYNKSGNEGLSAQVTCFGVTDPELRSRSSYKKNEGLLSLIIHGINGLKEEETMDTINTERYLQSIEKLNESSPPSFYRLSLWDPHSPYFPIKKYSDLYASESVRLPENWRPDYSQKPQIQEFFYRARGFHHLSEEDYQKAKASYYGLISHNDDRVGRVIQKLKDKNLYDDSIIIFTSDHGAMMGEQGSIEKWGHLYEPVVRIPLLIKLPGQKFGNTRKSSFTENVDLLPSLLDLVGIEIPENLHGKSLVPYINQKNDFHKDSVFSTYISHAIMDQPAFMIRHKNWKYTYYGEQSLLESKLPRDHFLRNSEFFDRNPIIGELYDLNQDPEENDNLFNNPKYKEVQEDLSQRLEIWLEELGKTVEIKSTINEPTPWSDFRLQLEGNFLTELSKVYPNIQRNANVSLKRKP